MSAALQAPVAAAHPLQGADLERRFSGLRRLYGEASYAKLRSARLSVVGVGGVGSWAAEALARCGVAELVLVDLDHVAESNVHRQVQATTPTLGQAKVQALAERIALIHPGCKVHAVEEFAAADNWPALLPAEVQGVIDACDDVRAKQALARWSLATGTPLVSVGAAGGKRHAERVEVADLTQVTHDPLLGALRQRLRRDGAIDKGGASKTDAKRTLRCVFSREAVAPPGLEFSLGSGDGSLNCSGYGSAVMVTATFGMVAAGEAIEQLLARGGAAPA